MKEISHHVDHGHVVYPLVRRRVGTTHRIHLDLSASTAIAARLRRKRRRLVGGLATGRSIRAFVPSRLRLPRQRLTSRFLRHLAVVVVPAVDVEARDQRRHCAL